MFVASAQVSGDEVMCRWVFAKDRTIGEDLKKD